MAHLTSPAAALQAPTSAGLLAERFLDCREQSAALAAGLGDADLTVQSMEDVSPGKWHLAHTTWFFETFVLERASGYQLYHPDYRVLFNSYYNMVGEQFPREQRGLISRPILSEVLKYRRAIDARCSNDGGSGTRWGLPPRWSGAS